MDFILSMVILDILFFTPSHPPWRWGLNLDLNGTGSIIIHLSDPESYAFDTNIGRFRHVTPFPHLGVQGVSSPTSTTTITATTTTIAAAAVTTTTTTTTTATTTTIDTTTTTKLGFKCHRDCHQSAYRSRKLWIRH